MKRINSIQHHNYFLKWMLCSLLLLTTFNGYGDIFATKPHRKIVLTRKRSAGSDYKLEPEKEYLSAYYDPSLSVLVFDIPEDIEALSAVLASPYTGHQWSFTVNPEAPEWYVTLSNGFYALTCTDQDGEVYQGTFLLE